MMWPAPQRTEATLQAPDGRSFKVTKGAAHSVLGLIEIDAEVTASAVNRKVSTDFKPKPFLQPVPQNPCRAVGKGLPEPPLSSAEALSLCHNHVSGLSWSCDASVGMVRMQRLQQCHGNLETQGVS